jgi:hypothetical protein
MKRRRNKEKDTQPTVEKVEKVEYTIKIWVSWDEIPYELSFDNIEDREQIMRAILEREVKRILHWSVYIFNGNINWMKVYENII